MPEPLAAIARFAASPAGIFTAMTEMARRFAESGASMLELAEKSGTTVEAVSALAYAARRCNVDAEGLAGGLKKMQIAIFEAARGGQAGIEASQKLGLNLAALAKLPAERAVFPRLPTRLQDFPTRRSGRRRRWPSSAKAGRNYCRS